MNAKNLSDLEVFCYYMSLTPFIEAKKTNSMVSQHLHSCFIVFKVLGNIT